MSAKSKQKSKNTESDSAYFLKLVLFIVLGSIWLRFSEPVHIGPIMFNGLPIGLGLGLIFASHDHFQIDRKIEYALLLVMAILTFFLPAGIVI
ncbi:MAG TPA: hypothetical protein VF597_04240 [Candidatus Saccharimonadales bacterium]